MSESGLSERQMKVAEIEQDESRTSVSLHRLKNLQIKITKETDDLMSYFNN